MTETRPGKVDDGPSGAATTVRFLLLVLLLLVSSAAMMMQALVGLSGSNDGDGLGCLLAAGGDPFAGDLTMFGPAVAQAAPMSACTARYEPPPAWWLTVGWPVLVVLGTAVLVAVLPRWKARRSRVVPLWVVDRGGRLAALAEEAATAAGLARAPRIVVDPVVASTGAVVFGHNRQPVVRLDGGLVSRAGSAPGQVRTVLLHEFAHIRYGDVTLTYVTVAASRVFVVLVLLPYLCWLGDAVWVGRRLADWSLQEPTLVRSALLGVVLVALVRLARADVLRTREVYADLAAQRWGARADGWPEPTRAVPAGRARRLVRALVAPWRTHPPWRLRRGALADPAVVLRVPALTMALAGAAGQLVGSQAYTYLERQYQVPLSWLEVVTPAAGAALAAVLAGWAVWRAVLAAVVAGDPVPSGLVAGCWLGAGMAAAELVTDDIAGHSWLPGRPALLLLLPLAGMAFTGWVGQCARCWAGGQPGARRWADGWLGRAPRLVTVLTLAGGGLAMAAWLSWWQETGTLWTAGFPIPDPSGLPASSLAAGLDPYLASAVVQTDLTVETGGPLAVAGATALCLAPLLAWLATGRPGRVLGAGVAGGAAGWLGLAVVMAVAHPAHPPANDHTDLYISNYFLSVLLVWCAAVGVGALLGTLLADRHRSLAALVAGQLAATVALAGMFPLAALDGCVPGLAALRGSCAWRPGVTWPIFRVNLPTVLVLGPLIGFAVAAAVTAVRVGWRPRPRPVAAGRSRPAVRWLAVMTVALALLGSAAAGIVVQHRTSTPTSDRQVAADSVDAPTTTSIFVRGLQVSAWLNHGGQDMLERLTQALAAAATASTPMEAGAAAGDPVRGACGLIEPMAAYAAGYFRIPDPAAQVRWHRLLDELADAGYLCREYAADGSDVSAGTVAAALVALAKDVDGLTERLDAVLVAGLAAGR